MLVQLCADITLGSMRGTSVLPGNMAKRCFFLLGRYHA
jgi:hypothetical protein